MTDYLFAPERYVGDGFVIRSYLPGDGPLLTEAVNSSYEHLSPFMEWATPDQSEETSERLARQFRGRYLLAEDFVLGIFAPDEQRLLGGSGFHLRHGPLGMGIAEIGMWIRGSEAGHGLGTAVLRALCHWGFTEWPWQRLVWRCRADNLASRRTAEKVGLMLEGVLRQQMARADGPPADIYCYAILKSEWEGRSPSWKP